MESGVGLDDPLRVYTFIFYSFHTIYTVSFHIQKEVEKNTAEKQVDCIYL